MMDCISRKNSYSIVEEVDGVIVAYDNHPCEDKRGWKNVYQEVGEDIM
jgi:hypothetical protein